MNLIVWMQMQYCIKNKIETSFIIFACIRLNPYAMKNFNYHG